MSGNMAHVSDVDVYNTSTDFDYRTYRGLKAEIAFYHVDWDRDYSNVVMFESKAKRDEYLASIKDEVEYLDAASVLKGLELFSPVTMRSHGSIRVPLPYQNAVGYNYLKIKLPKPPVPGASMKPRRDEFFFFVSGYQLIAPNTTEYTLEPDVWTTNVFGMEVSRMTLAEGHFPACKTSPDEYLADPLNNHTWLGGSEGMEQNDTHQVACEKWVGFQSDEQYAVVFAAADYWGDWNGAGYPDTLAVGGYDSSHTESPGRTGYGLAGHAEQGAGVASASGVAYPTGIQQGILPTSYWTFAVKLANLKTVYDHLAQSRPLFLECVAAVAVVPGTFLTLTPAPAIGSVPAWRVGMTNKTLAEIAFTPADFGYQEWSREWTKMYASPLAAVRIMSGDRTAYVDVEQIHALKVKLGAVVNYPWLRAEAFLEGIGGDSEMEYTYIVSSTSQQKRIGSDFWRDFRFDVDIPVMGLYTKPGGSAKARSAAQLALKERTLAEKLHMANEDAAVSNLASKASALTAKGIADRDASTAHSDSDESGNSAYSQKITRATAQRTESVLSAQTARTNSDRIAGVNHDNAFILHLMQFDNTGFDIDATKKLSDTENEIENTLFAARQDFHTREWNADAAIRYASQAREEISAGLSALPEGPAGLALYAALLVATGVKIGVEDVNQAEKYNNYQWNKINIPHEQTLKSIERTSLYKRENLDDTRNNTKTATDATADNLLLAQQTCYAETLACDIANANTEYAAQAAAASRAHAEQVANASRDHGTANADNSDTLNSSLDTADSVRAAVEMSAINRNQVERLGFLESWVREASAAPRQQLVLGAEIHKTSMYQYATGTAGVSIQAVRCGAYQELAAAGKFARRGYKGSFPISVPKDANGNQLWNLCTKFTFWKADDLWVLSDEMNEPTQDLLRDAFKAGVTVWRDPHDIGRTDILDNRPIYGLI